MFVRTHRKAFLNLARQIRHALHVERDLMNPLSAGALAQLADECQNAAGNPAEHTPEKLKNLQSQSETLLYQSLSRYKRSSFSELLDIAAVALMVAMGVRAIALQPFKIPTGSMQPTLYGIHFVTNDTPDSSPVFPDWGKADAFLFGASRVAFTAPFDGRIREGSVHQGVDYGLLKPVPVLRELFGEETTSFVFEPVDELSPHDSVSVTLNGGIEKIVQSLSLGAAERRGRELSAFGPWRKGETLIDGYMTTGDQLFVDRISHLFCPLKRGDVTVFNTEGIHYRGQALSESGFYYIKRLVGLPGDTLRIRSHHLEIRPAGETAFVPVEKLDARFEKLYGGQSGYQGHLGWEKLAREAELTVPEDHYFLLGDNSRSSSDGRYWGFVPRRNIVGRACFVFWPFSARWGLTDRANAVQVPSGWKVEFPGEVTEQSYRPLPVMSLQ